MSTRKEELLEEIRQINDQYKREVPGKRRAWPESIKSRVRELQSLGVKFSPISVSTGIPYHTILTWRVSKSKPGFNQLAIVNRRKKEIRTADKVATVTVATSQEVPTVTVTTLSGMRIEGLSFEFLVKLLPELRGFE